MSLSLAALVAGSLLSVFTFGGVAGLLAHNRQARKRWASQTWRDLTLRNGVAARSPFHSDTSTFNAPGLVRVYPRSHTPTPHADTPTDEQVHTARPLPTSALPTQSPQQVPTVAAPMPELPSEPLALSDPADPAERARCRRLYQQGLSQTKVIKGVWGISKGGGYKYNEARRRFRVHVRDIASRSLLASIQEDEAKADA